MIDCQQCGETTNGRFLAHWKLFENGHIVVCEECAESLQDDGILTTSGLVVVDQWSNSWSYCENESAYGYPCRTPHCPHCSTEKVDQ